MTKMKLHNDCKVLSGYVYKSDKPKEINGWQYSKSCQGSNGFYAEIYKKNNDIMIVFKGTDFTFKNFEGPKDADDDHSMVVSKFVPRQIENAREVYNDYAKAYPNSNIILTGHSLGGSIAQVLGAETGAETITFAAYGTGNLYGTRAVYKDNITNYGNSKDPVYISNIDNQVGKTILLNSGVNQADVLVKSEQKLDKLSKAPHFLENFGDLSKGIEYKKEEFDTPFFKTGIEHVDYDDRVFDLRNRVFYSGEMQLEDMDDEIQNHFLDQVFDNEKMPTKEELDRRTRFGELVYVNNYVRSDGTKVSGYYRAYPR